MKRVTLGKRIVLERGLKVAPGPHVCVRALSNNFSECSCDGADEIAGTASKTAFAAVVLHSSVRACV